MKKITVLIVDDSALIRTMFSEMLNAEPDIEVVGTATDPIDAREKIKRLNPQVITLDIEMPKMDGLSFLEKIMRLRPMPVIMASTLTEKGATTTIRALELGAVDYVFKFTDHSVPNMFEYLRQELAMKIRTAATIKMTPRNRISSETGVLSFTPRRGAMPIIAMGSSTGGVEALRDIFQSLPANCPPMVMTQHMPDPFTKAFASRLNNLSRMSVSEAKNGDKLMPGHAYLAPGNKHLRIAGSGNDFICLVEEGPEVSGHCPSVDVLFSSVAEAAGDRAVGVLLTGMGKDGADGMLKMREAGAYTIGQSESSCIVYGMPRAAARLGAVDIELPLPQIAGHLLNYCAQERKSRHAL